MFPVYTKDGISKPLNQCNLDESLELKDMLSRKYLALQSIGKSAGAYNFALMIKQIDDHMIDLGIQAAKELEEKKKLEEEQSKEKSSKFDVSYWTRGFMDKNARKKEQIGGPSA